MIGVLRSRGRLVALVGSGLLALVGMASVPASATGHSAALQTKWARYSFHSGGSGYLQVVGSAKIVPGAFFAAVDVDRPGSTTPRAFFPFILDLDAFTSADTYGAVGDRDLCAGPVDCHLRGGRFTFSEGFSVDGDGPPIDVNAYLVLRGADVTMHDVLVRGWSARHLPGGVFRVTADDAGGAGVDAFGDAAGANTGASAPGPNEGSVAVAVPACDQVGAGVLVLTGGGQTQTAICPSGPVAGVAQRATTWTASGAVAGASSYSTRLLVIRR